MSTFVEKFIEIFKIIKEFKTLKTIFIYFSNNLKGIYQKSDLDILLNKMWWYFEIQIKEHLNFLILLFITLTH